jgi:hypothetical protein
LGIQENHEMPGVPARKAPAIRRADYVLRLFNHSIRRAVWSKAVYHVRRWENQHHPWQQVLQR